MKTKPILFSTPMVQAILNGTKIQTRRVVKASAKTKKEWFPNFNECNSIEIVKNGVQFIHPKGGPYTFVECPFGQVGDVLWVRETFVKYPVVGKNGEDFEFEYKADGTPIKFRWKPAIHMPKEACRLFLKIKDIRVERLQDISEEDAICEGAQKARFIGHGVIGGSIKEGFYELWTKINGYESLQKNPWVWVIEFERIEKPENF